MLNNLFPCTDEAVQLISSLKNSSRTDVDEIFILKVIACRTCLFNFEVKGNYCMVHMKRIRKHGRVSESALEWP